MQGADAVAAVLAQLEGFEAPAGGWESDLLPSRIKDYDPHWLDEHCRAGRFVWVRQARKTDRDRAAAAGPIRSTPIALLVRRHVKAWSSLATPYDGAQLTSRPRAVFDFIREHGASFFDDIVDGVRMLPVEVEEALADLVSLGLVNADSFGGLRALLVPSSQRGRSNHRGRRGRLPLFDMADAGRWAIVQRAVPESTSTARVDEAAVEQVVRTLLRRWGVIFWKLLAREAEWLPSWRDILMCCRRLEARGEIRGGRFVAGLAGEQYADPAAIGLLREARRRPLAREYVSVSGADPLNLLGIVTPGARLPSITGNRLLYLDGTPLATYAGNEVTFLGDLEPKQQWEAHQALLRGHASVPTPATRASLPASLG
jgi:ATP-dependent Lhr-like helicase